MQKIHGEQKDQLLINKRKSVGLKHCNEPKAFIDCSNDMMIL